MPIEDSGAIVQRIFVRAAERVGSAMALGRHLGLNSAELRLYLHGEAIPPQLTLLRTVDLIIDDIKALRGSSSESAWQSLFLAGSSSRS